MDRQKPTAHSFACPCPTVLHHRLRAPHPRRHACTLSFGRLTHEHNPQHAPALALPCICATACMRHTRAIASACLTASDYSDSRDRVTTASTRMVSANAKDPTKQRLPLSRLSSTNGALPRNEHEETATQARKAAMTVTMKMAEAKKEGMSSSKELEEVCAIVASLASLPDDMLLLVVGAFSETEDDVPLFVAVKGLGCLSKGMRQQLHRLRPLVGVQSLAVLLAVVQRPTHGPWRVTLLYTGELTEAVVDQARQGRVRSTDSRFTMRSLAPAVARRVVPELLGAGSSLLDLKLDLLTLYDTWASPFGEVAVCSAVLRSLSLRCCGLRGPLPELRLPALQKLDLYNNWHTGGLEPLRGCTALRDLDLGYNKLTGGLEPLRAAQRWSRSG